MPPPTSSSPRSGFSGRVSAMLLRRLRPLRLGVGERALAAAFPPVAGFLVAAEPGGRVEQVGRVDPHHARLELRRDIEREVDRFRPDRRGEPVGGVVGERDGLLRRAEAHRHRDRPEDFDLRHGRRRLDVGEQRRRDRSSPWPAATRRTDRASRPRRRPARPACGCAPAAPARRSRRGRSPCRAAGRRGASRAACGAWRRTRRGRPPAPEAANRRSRPGPD